ncbi:aminotransferase class IV [Teredinibacter waterburyi]|jgi:Branched-chain amino acid aminotransferase/4-amino-4-deoxychorismate lyase|uniref:aminotransferase class IV n=1 Tax=Teredinibacter waterburyi TaxID=1500538 RepID=UPI00165ED413|nr:aminotransferase class IV [Teredinibacter waterburyi]
MTLGQHECLFLNGKQLAPDGATSSYSDRGFLLGDGVFETLRFQLGGFPFLDYHLDRLAKGCTLLGISLDISQLRRELDAFSLAVGNDNVQSNIKDGIARITCTRGVGGRGNYFSANLEPSRVLQFRPTNILGWLQPPVDVVSASHRLSDNPALAGLKHLSRLDYSLAVSRSKPQDNQELLLLDSRDCLVETVHHNIFVKQGENLLTPTIQRVGVAGVMRRLVIENCSAAALPNIVETDISLAQLRACDYAFLTNAARGIVPIASIDGKNCGSGDTSEMALIAEQVSNMANRLRVAQA